MTCPKCKRNIPNQCKFCPECGADIKAAIYALLAPYSNPTSLADIIAMPPLPEEWMDVIYTPEERANLKRMCDQVNQLLAKKRGGNVTQSAQPPLKASQPPIARASKPIEKRRKTGGTVDSARDRDCAQKRSWLGSLFRKLFW